VEFEDNIKMDVRDMWSLKIILKWMSGICGV
jgi:hypothetical protein